MIDVRTLKLIPRTREHLFTYCVGAEIPEEWLDVIRLRVDEETGSNKKTPKKGCTDAPKTLEEIKQRGLDLSKRRDCIDCNDPAFFDELFANDIFDYNPKNSADGMDVCRTVQIILGYAITGFAEHQIFPYFHGRGSNGKSLLDKMLGECFHPIYRSISYGALCSKDKNNDELYDAVYARLLSVNETDANGDDGTEGRQLNWVTLKHITGGDKGHHS